MAFPHNTTPLDDFKRADEGPPPSSSWSDEAGEDGLQVSSYLCAGEGAGNNYGWWNTKLGPQCEVYATIDTLPNDGQSIVLYARFDSQDSGNGNGYSLEYGREDVSADVITVNRIDGGGDTALLTINQNMAVGDTIGLWVVGDLLIAWRKTAAGVPAPLGSATDTTYAAAGYVGMSMDETTPRVSAFGGGTFSDTIRTQIYAITSSVSGTGLVYDYKRYARSLYGSYLNLFKTDVSDQGVVRGFDIEAGPVASERLTFRDDGAEGINNNHTFFVHGYLSWIDANRSEEQAEILARAVKTALDNSNVLHDGNTYYNADPANITNLEARRQAGILINYIRIQQNVYIQVE